MTNPNTLRERLTDVAEVEAAQALATPQPAPVVDARVLGKGFERRDGMAIPTVLVGFAPDDWKSRDAFAEALATQPASDRLAQPEDQAEKARALIERIDHAVQYCPSAERTTLNLLLDELAAIYKDPSHD